MKGYDFLFLILISKLYDSSEQKNQSKWIELYVKFKHKSSNRFITGAFTKWVTHTFIESSFVFDALIITFYCI